MINLVFERSPALGDASYNPWAVGLRGRALSSDGLPVLFAEQQPSLDDYEYLIDAKELGRARLVRGFSRVFNYITVMYTPANGIRAIVTPDDDATLMDTDSMAAPWGTREYVLSAGNASLAEAVALGARFLAEHKDPPYYVSGAIQVQDSIPRKGGSRAPVSRVRAGERVRIMNVLDDLSGDGLTLLITGTKYTHKKRTVSLAMGVPDDMAVFVVRMKD